MKRSGLKIRNGDMNPKPTVLQQVAALQKMDGAALRNMWTAFFGREAPAAYKPEQIIRRLAWRIQELHYGGLSDGARQRLREIVEGDELSRGPRPSRRTSKRKGAGLSPGTRLVRHWHGVEHIVTATADGGLEYMGKRYRTLSAVAKTISGQHCSGPRFFGLAGSVNVGSGNVSSGKVDSGKVCSRKSCFGNVDSGKEML